VAQTRDGEPDRNTPELPEQEPLVELAPDEAVLRALSQSAHPVEWAEAHKSDQPS
jgi:hypothetical protein